MQVVDANVVIDALSLRGNVGDSAREVIARRTTVVPHLLDVEVLHVLRRLERRGFLSGPQAGRAVRGLSEMPVTRRSHHPLIPRIWDLRDNLTPYDASYVALAEALGCPLVTADARLAAAPGVRCEIVVLSA
ncbi:type II toxin-antitoxin system VapC family toxin [Aeromicrobium sp. UC242_57]|uniref:type II toxin-antitoxin system VapC family toxin n=1 Tax=Aeromicrobium sp. UC242_57 TaxID=3374624 RepID=UPI003790ED7B